MARFSAITIFNVLKSRKKNIPPLPETIWQNPLHFIAFGLGSGTMPFAPGTFGTLMAIPFYLLFRPLPVMAYIAVVIFFIIASSLICERASRDIHIHDHPGMCLDEFAGFFVTMIAAPHSLTWIILGFFLFRFFDIVKPWPISFIDQHIHGGIGMILDDVVAGLFAWVIMRIVMMI